MARINTPTNYTILPPSGKPAERPQKRDESTIDRHRPPTGRGVRFIPDDSLLGKLIERGIAAFRQGVVWDRGSILNIEA